MALINPTTITGHHNVAKSNVDFSFHNEIDISFKIEGKLIKINFSHKYVSIILNNFKQIIGTYIIILEGDEIVLDTQNVEPVELVEDINHFLLVGTI